MKKLLLAAALLLATHAFAQQAITYTEFTYISRGLIDDVSKGKDVKQGYRFERFTDAPTAASSTFFEKKKYEIVKCYRINEFSPFALAIYLYTNGALRRIMCVPNKASDVNILSNARADFGTEFSPLINKETAMLWECLVFIATTIKQ